MSESPEHKFVSEQLNATLVDVSETRLFGVTEAQRRTFDYACVLMRDFSRPLVSQVLWRHEVGIDKDIRTLLHDHESLLKVYFVADTIRSRLDEALASYRSDPALRKLLRGLRLVFLPNDFDADREHDRQWMARYLEECVTRDILFGVLFGRLNRFEFRTFLGHNGPVGLEYAILHEISQNGLYHMPTFKETLGYSTNGPIREALAMLAATGLIQRVDDSNCYLPTIKGRLLLDLTRLLMYEAEEFTEWSDETALIMQQLAIEDMPECELPTSMDKELLENIIARNLFYGYACGVQFNRALLDKDDKGASRRLYSDYEWQRLLKDFEAVPFDLTQWLQDEESLLFVGPASDKAK